MKSSEVWSLTEGGKILKIVQKSSDFRGVENTIMLVFEKQ
jgi:hypothetical protein